MTIPIATRKALALHEGDPMAFRLLHGGKVEMFKVTSGSSNEATVAAYLQFLEQELMAKSGQLKPFARPKSVDALIKRVQLDDWLAEDTEFQNAAALPSSANNELEQSR